MLKDFTKFSSFLLLGKSSSILCFPDFNVIKSPSTEYFSISFRYKTPKNYYFSVEKFIVLNSSESTIIFVISFPGCFIYLTLYS